MSLIELLVVAAGALPPVVVVAAEDSAEFAVASWFVGAQAASARTAAA